jgi:hypothetical protein
MTDVREDILARLLEVVTTIPNLRFADRNNEDVDETRLPAAIVLDGDEETKDGTDLSQRPANRPTIVQMTPAIMLFDQEPYVGIDLITMRRELIRRVLNDTELNQLAMTARLGNGAIRYLGCEVGHAWLRNLHGAMKAQFLFVYSLRPDDL